MAAAILSKSPLGAGLSILHIEWMTLLHYVSSVRDSVDIDPQFSSLLRHHWLEESQHAKLDTLIVEAIARPLSEMFLLASYEKAAWSLPAARLAGFGVIAVGAGGCVLAGLIAGRIGRTTITIASLAVSGGCALTVGLVFTDPGLLTALCLVWGFAVVADSAQFSAAVSELTDPRYVGTTLTVQTSLGFMLTLLAIQLIPPLVEAVGWQRAFVILALGPAFGAWSMWRLRRLPEALCLASGRR